MKSFDGVTQVFRKPDILKNNIFFFFKNSNFYSSSSDESVRIATYKYQIHIFTRECVCKRQNKIEIWTIDK